MWIVESVMRSWYIMTKYERLRSPTKIQVQIRILLTEVSIGIRISMSLGIFYDIIDINFNILESDWSHGEARNKYETRSVVVTHTLKTMFCH